MAPSEYAKAVLYRELGVFNEPLDQRRRTWKRKQRQQESEDEWEENSETQNEPH